MSSAYLSSTQVFCKVPSDMIAAGKVQSRRKVTVTVANFGEDYYGAHTVKNYVERAFTMICIAGQAGIRCQFSRSQDCNDRGDPMDDGSCICDDAYTGGSCQRTKGSGLPVWAIVLIAVVAAVAFALGTCIAVLIARERKGEPVFSSLTNPLLDTGSSNPQSIEIRSSPF